MQDGINSSKWRKGAPSRGNGISKDSGVRMSMGSLGTLPEISGAAVEKLSGRVKVNEGRE